MKRCRTIDIRLAKSYVVPVDWLVDSEIIPMSDPVNILYHDSVESVQAEEAGLTDKIVASMERVNRRVFDKHRHAIREAHAKTHGVLIGTLSVNSDLEPALRQGLFEEARDYPVVARLSSAPGDLHDDRISAPKGIAIKLIGATQDFLLVNFPIIPFGHIAAYWEMQQKMEKHADDSEIAQLAVSELAGKAAAVIGLAGIQNPTLEALGAPNHHILGETFYSMGAIRYGAYIAKISLAPLSVSVRSLTGTVIDTKGRPSAIRDEIATFFQAREAEYELRVQLCTDLTKMPVEDASVEWPEALSPWRPVAKLTFPAQDSYSPARRVYAEDVLSFNPWHCWTEHRPLGSIMRVRRKAYEASAQFRHEMNARTFSEPKNTSEIPD